MHVLIAVIDELYTFALQAMLMPLALFRKKHVAAVRTETTALEEDDANTLEPSIEKELSVPPQSFRRVEDIIAEESPRPAFGGGKNTVMYSGGTEVPMYVHPTQEFDSIITELAYGDMVMVLEQRGRWAHIVHGEQTGWVLREDLVDRAAHVYPKFVLGEPNNADDPNTVRVRAMIGDLFGGAKSELPLQSGEYVLYRLYRKGLTIEWPEIRPRTPGRWHTILKGVPGVHIGVSPKTGSIFESVHNDDRGHLAYVEAVFPDETINISEVNFPEDGIYNERVLTRDEWQDLKPIFIQVV